MSEAASKRSLQPVQAEATAAKLSTPNRDHLKKSDSGSKQSRVIAMLRSPTGATIAAMMETTGWQQHSVRGFLAGVVRKRLKLKLGSRKVEGHRVYQISSGNQAKSQPRPSRRRPS